MENFEDDWRSSLDLIVGSPAAEARRELEEEQIRLEKPARILAGGQARINDAFEEIWQQIEIAFVDLTEKDIGATVTRDANHQWVSIAARRHTLRIDLDVAALTIIANVDGRIDNLTFDLVLEYLVDQETTSRAASSASSFIAKQLARFLGAVASAA